MASPGTVDGGALLARALRAGGVEHVFALHGGHLNPFLAGCVAESIALVDGRHEAAVGNAADGYARATGGLGVAAVTAGAGFANCLPALVSAHLDRIPMLMITSSPPLRESELNELQGGIDQVGIVRPVTKWAHRVTSTERIPDLVALAVRKALSGPPGPVLLDVPVDIMFTSVREEQVPAWGNVGVGAPAVPTQVVVDEAVALLRASRRPVVVAGSGIRWARAQQDLLAFAERAQVPVFNQVSSYAGLPPDHPLNAYGAWNLGALAAELGAVPDLVLLLGARLGRYLGGRTGVLVPSEATVIQVDLDSTEIGRVRPIDLPVVADVGEVLRALTANLGDMPDWSDWSYRAAAVHRRPSTFLDEPTEIDGRMHPFHAVREVMRSIGPGATIIIDGGEAAGWAAESLHEARPADVMGMGGYLGILGLTTGLAIGTQVARPDDRVIVVCGDGAAGFNIQEFDTMVRHGLNVMTVVVNNALWAQSARGQSRELGSDSHVISTLADTNYDRVAEGFGAHGERVTRLADIPAAVERGFSSGLPSCLNLTVAPGPEPKTAAGMGKQPTSDSLAVPYYEAIPQQPY
jgi:acetolactate synthase I/II/III large subunit